MRRAYMVPRMVDTLFSLLVGNRTRVILAFYACNFLQICAGFFVMWASYAPGDAYASAYGLGLASGRAAIICYLATMVPGMARRFRIIHKGVSLLMIFRRYIGITMYLFVLIHVGATFIGPFLAGKFPLASQPLFIVAGFLAHLFLFSLCITSNDWSVKKLGMWWHRIHALTYPAVGLIFVHVALQRISLWSALIGIAAVFQVSSFIYAAWLKFLPRASIRSTSLTPNSDILP